MQTICSIIYYFGINKFGDKEIKELGWQGNKEKNTLVKGKHSHEINWEMKRYSMNNMVKPMWYLEYCFKQ